MQSWPISVNVPGLMATSTDYQVYGFCVRSPWELPCFQSIEKNASGPRIDLEQFSSAAVPDSIRDRQTQYAVLEDGATYLRWPGPTEFVVGADGRTIATSLKGPDSLATFHAVLFGGVFSVALLRMGIEPLHATAIVADTGAAAFIGDTGSGKSTLAAAFVQRGLQLLTDDLLVIDPQNDEFRGRPGLPRLKLCQDAASLAIESIYTDIGVNAFTHKHVVRLQDRLFRAASSPLRVLYALHRGPANAEVEIHRLSQQEAFVEICRAAFNTYITPPDRLRGHFDLAGRLAAGVAVKRLIVPQSFRALPRVCDTILADLTQ
jgi:hypothetical protein